MSDERSSLLARGEEFLQLFRKGADFTRQLLRENERLRRELADVCEQQDTAARSPEEWEKLRQELLARIGDLEQGWASARETLERVEAENRQFAARFLEVEEENNALATLYVAGYQLHSTLDLDELLKTVIEIAINLLGAERFAVYLRKEGGGELAAVAAEGAPLGDFPPLQVGHGFAGKALAAARASWREANRSDDLSEPIACIPLVVQGEPIGAIAIYGLLEQKEAFTPLDRELFSALGAHAATAIFAARLHSRSERRLSTIQGFIDSLAE
jgi:hypothetical protein